MRNNSAQKVCIRASKALIVLGLLATFHSAAAQETISLGAARNVAVLGASTVTNTGATTVIGNLALSCPEVSVTGSPTMVGGTIGLTKTGSGTLTLSGTNTYTGTTTINAGTLNAGAAGALGATANIVVNAGGTLLLSQSGTTNRINDSSTMTLNGGTFNTSGLSEHNLSGATVMPGIGALTLLNSSTIDLGAGASILAFANSSAQTWIGTLSIYNWSGTPITGGGTDQLYFGTDSTGLNATQLSQIAFYSDFGSTFLGTANYMAGMDGELGPVPEPSTWFAAVLTCGSLAFTQRKRLRKFLSR